MRWCKLWRNKVVEAQIQKFSKKFQKVQSIPLPHFFFELQQKLLMSDLFASIPLRPSDSIFGLVAAFKADPNEKKVNLVKQQTLWNCSRLFVFLPKNLLNFRFLLFFKERWCLSRFQWSTESFRQCFGGLFFSAKKKSLISLRPRSFVRFRRPKSCWLAKTTRNICRSVRVWRFRFFQLLR